MIALYLCDPRRNKSCRLAPLCSENGCDVCCATTKAESALTDKDGKPLYICDYDYESRKCTRDGEESDLRALFDRFRAKRYRPEKGGQKELDDI